MKRNITIALSLSLLAANASTVHAETEAVTAAEVAPIRSAFEVAVGLAAANGNGDIGAGMQSLDLGIETEDDREQSFTGLELAKLQVGLDYRVSPRFAIGPVLGVSASMYRTQYDDAMSENARNIDDKSVNWTIALGVQGRYDAFGTH